MVTETEQAAKARFPLSRERILTAAVGIADQAGLEFLTMRGLAESLDVEAMSLYYHVANKEALLDGVAQKVVEEINEAVSVHDPATGPEDWKRVMRTRILTARTVMLRHTWAPALLESRNAMNSAALRYFHGLVEVFRAGGIGYDLAHHALHALGSRALGFTQELFDPAPGSADEEISNEMMEEMATELPLLAEMMAEITHEGPETTLGWCDDQTEFEFGLDLILDGLDRRRQIS